MVDLFTDDLDSLKNDQLFSAIKEFSEAQPCEGYRHDFKLKWNNDGALQSVAAFANTFGGLLFIGVKKQRTDTHATLVGVESDIELKTGIASSIATNITPTPSYNISECHDPADPKKRFCIVRVRNSTTLHLISKKGIPPAYIRNEDESIPADALQLRRLIERERQGRSDLVAAVLNRVNALSGEMRINEKYAGTDPLTWHLSNRQESVYFLKLVLIPAEELNIVLDQRDEHKFVNLLNEFYPRMYSTLQRDKANNAENRGADYYEYVWHHKSDDYEARWRITDKGEIVHATQMRCHDKWSLVDAAIYTILILRLGVKWWEERKYFGETILAADLRIDALNLERGTGGIFLTGFDPRYATIPAKMVSNIAANAVQILEPHRGRGQAQLRLNFFDMRDEIPKLVTSLMNTLLRSLGHAVSRIEFEQDIRKIIAAMP